MRVMVIVKGDKNSEAGVIPDPTIFEQMGKFNEQLVNAGVMQAGEGLQPTSKGVRVKFTGKNASVHNGPFGLTDDTIAGFWLWTVKSVDDAINWIKKSPFQDTTIEIRPLYEMEDFGENLTPELREQEERLRAKAEQIKKTA